MRLETARPTKSQTEKKMEQCPTMLNNHHGCFYTTSERLDLERELKESLNPTDLTVFLSKHFPSSPATVADSDEPETARFAAPNAEEEEGRKRRRRI